MGVCFRRLQEPNADKRFRTSVSMEHVMPDGIEVPSLASRIHWDTMSKAYLCGSGEAIHEALSVIAVRVGEPSVIEVINHRMNHSHGGRMNSLGFESQRSLLWFAASPPPMIHVLWSKNTLHGFQVLFTQWSIHCYTSEDIFDVKKCNNSKFCLCPLAQMDS